MTARPGRAGRPRPELTPDVGSHPSTGAGPGTETVSGRAQLDRGHEVSMFVPVTVVSGFDRVTVDDLTTGLLLRSDRLAVVYGDPSGAEQGYVAITVHDSDGLSRTRRIELEHHCASCTLRAATIAALTHLGARGDYDTLLLHLHPGIEPDAALRALATGFPPALRLNSHVTVLPPDWRDILSGSSTLIERGAGITPNDDRAAATVLCAGIETATTIALPTTPHDHHHHDRHLDSSRRLTNERANEDRAVLDLLAPAAIRLRLRSVLDAAAEDILSSARLDLDRLNPLAAYGIRDPHRALSPAGSLTLVRWHANRPLHPLRLHAALDQLADGVIRSSGRLDVADQPDSVVGWDSSIAFLGDDLDTAHIHAVLDACLLTDDELAILTCSWDDFTKADHGWPATTAEPQPLTDDPPANPNQTAAVINGVSGSDLATRDRDGRSSSCGDHTA